MKLLGIDSKLKAQQALFDELSALIWEYGIFMDSQGKYESDRDFKEIKLLWNKYHEINEKMRGLK